MKWQNYKSIFRHGQLSKGDKAEKYAMSDLNYMAICFARWSYDFYRQERCVAQYDLAVGAGIVFA